MATNLLHLDEHRTPSPALSALTRKRAELAGEADALAKRLDHLRADLAHLDAAIRILCPDARPELIKPKIPGRRGADWFGRGELGRMVLDTLRRSAAPLHVETIASAIMDAKGLPADAPARRRVENMVKGALHRQAGLAVERIVIGPRDVRWSISER
jgi:hypothetical protein